MGTITRPDERPKTVTHRENKFCEGSERRGWKFPGIKMQKSRARELAIGHGRVIFQKGNIPSRSDTPITTSRKGLIIDSLGFPENAAFSMGPNHLHGRVDD